MGRRSCTHAVAEALEGLGVRHVFAYPGTEILGLLEGLRTSSLQTVVPTNELAGTFMALGYARASGRVGVTAVPPGPGLAFSFPGLAEARYDSVPLVVLTGERDVRAPFDLGEACGAVVKAVLAPAGPGELIDAVREGHAVALSGEPGPVVVRLPAAALSAPAPSARPIQIAAEPRIPDERLAETCDCLRQAERVVLLVGQGAADAAAEVGELTERLGAAVLATTSGRGLVPESHPRSLVVDSPGYGAEGVNRLLREADLVLALGCRFNPNGTLGRRLKFDPGRLIDIDAGPKPADGPSARLRVQTDVPAFVRSLLAALPAEVRVGWSLDELKRLRLQLNAARTAAARVEPRLTETTDPKPAAFFAALRAALPPEGILVTDSGLHQQLARRHFQVLRPRTLLLPADFQSMGFGLPAAIGAALADPRRPVVGLIGDGGLAISGLELLTAVRERVPLTIVVFNDGSFNLIRLQQLSRYGREHGVTHPPPDLPSLAQTVGARYVRVGGDPAGALTESIRSGAVTLVEVEVGDTPWIRQLATAGAVRRIGRRGRSVFRKRSRDA